MAEFQSFQIPMGDLPQTGNVFGLRRQPITIDMKQFMRSYAIFQHAAQIFSDCPADEATLWTMLDLGAHGASCLEELCKCINVQPAVVQELKTCQGAGWSDIIISLNVAFLNGQNKTIAFRGIDETFTRVLAALSNLMKQMIDNLLSFGDPAKTHVAVLGILSFNWTCKEVEAKARANIISGNVKGAAEGVRFLLSGTSPHNKYTWRTLPSAGQSQSNSLPSQVRRAATTQTDFLSPE
jgi:hypothetical protein